MPSLTLTIGNDIKEFKALTRRLLAFLDEFHVSGSAAYAARVAVEELVVNVIRHAFDDEDAHTISVEVCREDDALVVRVEDDGRPFDPTASPKPDLSGAGGERRVGGWGIYLVRSMSDGMSYTREGNRNRVEVSIGLAHNAK